jgi:hypothetical protein
MRLQHQDAANGMSRSLNQRLATASPAVFTVVASIAGFATYFAMYAFRKPFSAATFEQVDGWHLSLDFKVAAVIAQVVGYAVSKFVGIKVMAQLRKSQAAPAILLLIGGAWLALVLFGFAPAWIKVLAMFANGLCLGMIWGLVFSFMEGRRTSEVLGAVLCASFIVSSGAVKSIGIVMIHTLGVPAFWMPAVTGALFVPVLLVSVWVLSCLPSPSPQDEALRVRRAPMTNQEMRAFLYSYGTGVTMLVIVYVFATALRDFRDNFAAELWGSLGYANPGAVFTASEIPVAVVSLLALGVIVRVRSNHLALTVIHGIILLGLMLLGASTAAFDARLISPLAWMIACGAGLYLVYTPFNAMLFDRLVAFSGRVATAGFLIYVADAAGYAGSVALLLWRSFGAHSLNWLTVFRASIYSTSAIGIVLISMSMLYFHIRGRVSAPSNLALGASGS